MIEDDHTMSEQPDDAGLAKNTPETARTASIACDGYTTSEEVGSAPSGRIFPIREANMIVEAARSVADGGSPDHPGVTAALAIKLADVEKERDELALEVKRERSGLNAMRVDRDELAERVKDLSQPRVFNVAGLVDADLAERYESLRAERDGMIATGHVLEDNLDELAGKLEHVEAERDAAAENARQERDIAVGLYGVLSHQTELVDRLTDAVDREANDIGGESALSVLQLLGPHLAEAHDVLKLAGLRKPRCRVVTSPRFYSREQFDDATAVLQPNYPIRAVELVEAVAQALGMRRAS